MTSEPLGPKGTFSKKCEPTTQLFWILRIGLIDYFYVENYLSDTSAKNYLDEVNYIVAD